MEKIELKFKNYKCFGEEEQGFDQIFPINLIIGRNNSGKSALLDLVKYFVKPFDPDTFAHQGKHLPEFFISKKITPHQISAAFPQGWSGGAIGGNHYDYGIANFSNSVIKAKLSKDSKFSCVSISPEPPQQLPDKFQTMAANISNFLFGKKFNRLLAERDICPESDSPEMSLSENGNGATNIIQNFINKSNLPSNLVEKNLLDSLNAVFYPDSTFTRIVTQKLQDGRWEIFLDEERKGRISLSNSGSGLKTVILVLINIILLPYIDSIELKNFIFGFEELENNLHPGLQRRLLAYIQGRAEEDKCLFFITTHSNVIIDMFSRGIDAQIIHVSHNGASAQARRIQTYLDRANVLDDLDIRASDLLQANGVVWVEGPTDRQYFNKWIEIFSEGRLVEGIHYQCVFYGGRLLAHLTAGVSANEINILNVNRNSILLMDSDRASVRGRINATKKRMADEVDKMDGYVWVTCGREIENYIPNSILKAIFGPDIKEIGQFEKIETYLDDINSGSTSKIILAEKVCELIEKENLVDVLDFKKKISKAIDKINSWNKK